MQERPPKGSAQEGITQITRESVIESLRAEPENLEPLNTYLLQREAAVDAANTPRAGLLLTVELATICRDAGRTEYAVEYFEIALFQAEQRQEFADIAKQCLEVLSILS